MFSISTSQIFRSWVAIFQPRPPMASISQLIRYARNCSSYECFILRATTFKEASRTGIRQGTLEIVIEEVLLSIWGSYQTIWSFPLTNVKWHFVTRPYTMSTSTDQTLYWTRPFTEFWVVSIENFRRLWNAEKGRLLLRTPGPVPLGLAYVLLVETSPFPNLSLFYQTMLFEYPKVLSRFCFLPPPMYHCWWTSPRGYLSGCNFIWMTRKVNLKVAGTSPTIKRFQTGMFPDTGMSAEVGSHIVSDDDTLWYKNADRFIQIKLCQVNFVDILKDHTFDPTDCQVSKCGTKNCKTCNILNTDNSFFSNFTKCSFLNNT